MSYLNEYLMKLPKYISFWVPSIVTNGVSNELYNGLPNKINNEEPNGVYNRGWKVLKHIPNVLRKCCFCPLHAQVNSLHLFGQYP